uniref:Uncharacterized protein n=1 Tax=viral metagenome TaxID=1070528 RepID=A0A6H1ZZG1_9ZZZZ
MTNLYNLLLPSMKHIKFVPKTSYVTNSILFKSVLIYGKIGSGKSEIYRSFVEKAVKKYGIENVNAQYVTKGKYLRYLLEYGLDNKLIQCLFVDDATLSKIPKDVMEDYFRIRHKWYELTNRPYGYILSFIAAHRFYGVHLSLRSDNDTYIFLTSPTSPFDRSVTKKYIGEEGIARLQFFEEQRSKRLNSKYKSYSIFNARGQTGTLIAKLARRSYMSEVRVPICRFM